MNDKVELTREQFLAELGIKPSWLGQAADGKIFEYRSYAWFAGSEAFVLVQEPGKPETANCMDLRDVKPLGKPAMSLAA